MMIGYDRLIDGVYKRRKVTGGVVKAPPRDCYVSNKKIVAAAEFLRRPT